MNSIIYCGNLAGFKGNFQSKMRNRFIIPRKVYIHTCIFEKCNLCPVSLNPGTHNNQ
uniref:Uncharacterized protein n=1 Tax=Anguilla anguilla TaxID=7936 RepID=A0A0E9X387_ANGAN